MTEIVRRNDIDMAMLEQVVVSGNLTNLSPAQRLDYYRNVCESVGLNPLTRPFDYITLNSKLTLYAKKDATDQLRKIHGISISKPDMQYVDDVIMVAVTATDRTGRSDADVGVVTVANLKGESKANAIMKAITKAKRRVTLSMAGLGWLDETELDTIPTAQPIMVDVTTGEILLSQQEAPGRKQIAQSSNHTTSNGKAPQRPAQPATTRPIEEDVNYYNPDGEWRSMGEEAEANERVAKAASKPFVWPVDDESLEMCGGFVNAPDLQPQQGRLITAIREADVKSNGLMSNEVKAGKKASQYGTLSWQLDHRYGEGAHGAILSALCCRPINHVSLPGYEVKKVLDWLFNKDNEFDAQLGVLDKLVEALKTDLQQLEVA